MDVVEPMARPEITFPLTSYTVQATALVAAVAVTAYPVPVFVAVV
jgi:hypothetical protein